MPATKSSKRSRSSSRAPAAASAAAAGVFSILLLVGGVFSWWCFSRGYTLYYGDAEAHLNIARRILDSRTPGYEQIGTAWLPLPHVLLMPLAANDAMWRSGSAGAIVGVVCFALAGTALFAAARLLFDSGAAASCALALFALNPNLLYLQATPMNEPMLLAALLGALYFTVRLGRQPSLSLAFAAGVCAAAASMTRYEGWFVIPFLAAYVLFAGGWRHAMVFSIVAGLPALWWLTHNYWFYGNPLDFYNGPYSAKAIYERARKAGVQPYPAMGNWSLAWLYYRSAAAHCVGSPLIWLGAVGAVAALLKRAWWGLLLLALPPVFYVWSLHSSGNEIFIPTLWPHSYYNTRYALNALPLLALAAAGLVAVAPEWARKWVLAAIVTIAVGPWVLYPHRNNWICWKESEVNSDSRRAWTSQAAAYLGGHYRPGDGMLFGFGDLTGIPRTAGIPLKEGLHEGNGPHALASVMRPDLFLWEKWVIAIGGDWGSNAMVRAGRSGPKYDLVQTITVRGASPIEIYRRSSDNPIHEGAWRPQ